MNYAINFSCTNKEEASSEIWPENRWNATIKAINTFFHLEVLLRIRNNSCSDGFIGQRCYNERVCRIFKNWRREKRSWDLKQRLWLRSRELIAFVSFFLLEFSNNCIYNHMIMGPYMIYQVVIFMKRKKTYLLFFKVLSCNVILNSC